MRRMAPHQEPGDKPLVPPNSPSAAQLLAPNFWARITSLPLVQTGCEMYTASKSRHALLGAGLGVVERGVSMASTPANAFATQLVEKVPAVAHLDSIACTCLDKIETTVTVLPPVKMPNVKIPNVNVMDLIPGKDGYKRMTDMKQGASSALKTGVRKALLTYPGRQVIRGIDGMITMSEGALDNMNRQSQDDNSAPNECNGKPEENGHMTQITNAINKLAPTINRQKVDGVVTPPIKAWIQLLKVFKRLLADMSGVTNRGPHESSPVKPGHVPARRRVSPRKRVSKGMFISVRDYLLGLMGVHSTAEFFSGMKLHLGRSEPGLQDDSTSERKRKHDDIDEEDYASSEDSETLDLVKALENYQSDEDPDYNPESDGESSDSLEYKEQTDSDGEKAEGQSPKPATPHTPNLPNNTEPPSIKPQERTPTLPLSPLVVLQPEWKRKPSVEENQVD